MILLNKSSVVRVKPALGQCLVFAEFVQVIENLKSVSILQKYYLLWKCLKNDILI